ncbi:MAG TPA: LAGLIDADG family homing endonuclease [Candidatus Bilamarchaeaceae archaeon]|nr:LAGLIDADG family homing endonuclease [Candidatus Bilamarchaeaceae archaeon]
MGNIKCAVVGVGNCFAGLVQGIEYYKQHPEQKVIGIMHESMAGYTIHDIEFVCGFDVGENKIGKTINEAIYESPNLVNWIPKDKMAKTNALVYETPALDGVGIWVENKIKPIQSKKSTKQLSDEIKKALKETGAEIVVSYLPVGSEKATKFWAQICLDTGTGFVNCMPSFIGSDPVWAEKFKKANIPIVSDDIKGQVGATIVHRTLAKLCDDRGTKIDKTYQINVGGNSVTGDQEILFVHDGKVIKARIGDFIDEWIDVYGERREDGKDMVDVGKTNQNLQCFTIDEEFKVCPVKISALIRHQLNEDLYQIETNEGRKIKITKDHNVFILNEHGKLEAVPINSLKEKDTMIAVPRSLILEEKEDVKNISLIPYLKELFAQGISPEGNIRIHNHPEIKIPVNYPVTDELLQLVGLWLADGSFDREGSSNLEIACGNDPECMNIIENFTSKHNIGYKVRGQKQVAVRIMSKTLTKIFRLTLGLGGNCYTKRIPNWAFDLSNRQIAFILKGYISGDGTVTGKQIRWTTASAGLAEDIRTLLLRIGINSSVFREDYTHKNEKNSFKTDLRYIAHGIISSKEDVEEFIQTVGFIQSQKNERAGIAVEKLTKGNMHIIPKIELIKKWGIRTKSWARWPTTRAHIILDQINKVKDGKESNKIKNICLGDTRFLKIKKIKKIAATPQYVYDISVPRYERFICSNILIHNTDFLNMKEQERLQSKRISKTESVQSQLRQRLPDENIYVGPSDFIPFLGNTKIMFMRIEGRMWANIPYNMEVRLEVDDKANSAGIVVDAVRACKIALDRKMGGPLIGPSAYLMKHPPQQMSDEEARKEFERFIEGKN